MIITIIPLAASSLFAYMGAHRMSKGKSGFATAYFLLSLSFLASIFIPG